MSKETCASASSCDKSSCEGCPSAGGGIPKENLNKFSSVKKVIGVVSGKGGVGKSYVAASLACALKEAGFSVGILDADITGPSIPKMFGCTERCEAGEKGIEPAMTKDGIKIMSINVLMEDPEAPVIWRGPVIAGCVKQFWTDVHWGDVDYMIVDMPPGTGDVPLTVFQSLPVDGIVIVTSPQDLVKMIVSKAYNMALMMNVPVLGLVENFSYMECPDCGKKLYPFGESNIEEVAKSLDIKVLAKLPFNTEVSASADTGDFEATNHDAFKGAVVEITK